jgi:hypothetical protein
VGVFEQQELIGDETLLALGDELPLQFQRLAVIRAPEFPQTTLTH